jgi:hypothetical protein
MRSSRRYAHRGAAVKDEVVAILHLREEKMMLTPRVLALFIGEEWGEGCQPFLAALQQVPRSERVGQFLQARRIATLQERVGSGIPARRTESRDIYARTSAPVRIVHVEAEWVHPALLVLQMGAVIVFVSNGHQDASRFPRFQDRHHLVGFGIPEILFHELVAPALVIVTLRRLEN